MCWPELELSIDLYLIGLIFALKLPISLRRRIIDNEFYCK